MSNRRYVEGPYLLQSAKPTVATAATLANTMHTRLIMGTSYNELAGTIPCGSSCYSVSERVNFLQNESKGTFSADSFPATIRSSNCKKQIRTGHPMEKTAFHDINRANLVALFEGGDKRPRTLGFELEHVLLHEGTNAPVSYDEPGGVHDVLKRLASFYDEVHKEGDSIVGLSRDGVALSIEPAAQLEISAGPFHTVAQIEKAYGRFRDELDPILKEFGLQTPMIGYNPSACAKDLPLIPKFRYESMTTFLGSEAYEGICMMRGTASLQISIDYRDEADATRKLRMAEILAPILALMCDNSPVFEGKPRTRHMVRTAVWAGMNQDRVGTVPGSLRPDYSFADYADYIMTRGAILVSDAKEPQGWRYVAGQTFDEVYADREMTRPELEHALSMVWPDARLKNFVEIRPADAMPLPYSLAYAALIKAIFYSDRNLNALDAMLLDIDEAHVRQAKEALMQDGYQAEVYGHIADFWADELIALASAELDENELPYLAPLANLVAERKSLADKA